MHYTSNYLLFIPAVGSLFLTLSLLGSRVKNQLVDIVSDIKSVANGELDIRRIEKWKQRKDEFGLIANNLGLMSKRILVM